jgi:hypothetical protein
MFLIELLLASFLFASHEKYVSTCTICLSDFCSSVTSLRFDFPSNYRGTPEDSSRHTNVPRHTCGHFS